MCSVTIVWQAINAFFDGAPSKLKVARLLVELGLRIDGEGRIFCDDVEIPATKIAAAVKVDRRVVKETAKAILQTGDLRQLFLHLRPAGPLLREIAQYLGYGVVEIRAKPENIGIIAEASALIAAEGISIRQILAEDAEIYPDPKLTLITEKPVPGDLLPKFLKIPTVTRVTIA
jgi:predicted regulator of amino acid metabolism with ACT domain